MSHWLVSLGEPLLRLSPPRFDQIRRTTTLDVRVVGSQLNVAANLARLGLPTAFVTRLPDNPLGELALDSIRSYGVDTSHILLAPGERMGVTYVEFSAAPRAPVAIYDRADSSASRITTGTFPWDSILPGVRMAHTDGIFPGLSPSCRETTLAFLEAARRHNCRTSFDLNYREHLWTPEAAREAWTKLLPLVDVLVTNRDVSERVFGFTGDDAALVRQYADQFGCRVVCLTRRESLGLARGAFSSLATAEGQLFEGKRQEFEIVDRYGTGDAWLAGFLWVWGRGPGDDVSLALDFANALCALAHTIEGDVAHVTPDDVMALIGGPPDLRLKR